MNVLPKGCCIQAYVYAKSRSLDGQMIVKLGRHGDRMPQNIKRGYMEQITASELKARLDGGDDIQLIDVRQPDEYAFAKIEGAKLIPLGEIMSRMNELDQTRDTVIHCKMGGRSARAIEFLRSAGYTGSLKNLAGGITAWSNEVDPRVPKY